MGGGVSRHAAAGQHHAQGVKRCEYQMVPLAGVRSFVGEHSPSLLVGQRPECSRADDCRPDR